MLQSKGFKKFMAMAYGIGGAVVIVGALFKLMHWPFASEMLIAGLGTEAFIFVVSAFEPLPQEELNWSLVYPELAGGQPKDKKKAADTATPEGVLTKKLDDMLAKAKLDVGVVSSLTKSLGNLSDAAKQIGTAATPVADTNKYNKEINSAATHLQSINKLYLAQEAGLTKAQTAQTEVIKNQEKVAVAVSQKSAELSKQMDSLSKNISSLNNVYGGMLTAMGTKTNK